MRIRPTLPADLALLTAALDLPGVDIAATVSGLTSAALVAVPSYVGLSVGLPMAGSELTTLAPDDGTVVRTSLRLTLQTQPCRPVTDAASVVLVLFATSPGAFVDLAADLEWLTTGSTADVLLDADVDRGRHRHLATPGSRSTIDQALGVLIEAGRTPSQAEGELDERALRAGVARQVAAAGLLASLLGSAAGDQPPLLP